MAGSLRLEVWSVLSLPVVAPNQNGDERSGQQSTRSKGLGESELGPEVS